MGDAAVSVVRRTQRSVSVASQHPRGMLSTSRRSCNRHPCLPLNLTPTAGWLRLRADALHWSTRQTRQKEPAPRKWAPISCWATACGATAGNLRPASCGCRAVRSSRSTSLVMLGLQVWTTGQSARVERRRQTGAAAVAAGALAAILSAAVGPPGRTLSSAGRAYQPPMAQRWRGESAGAGPCRAGVQGGRCGVPGGCGGRWGREPGGVRPGSPCRRALPADRQGSLPCHYGKPQMWNQAA